MTRAAYMRTAGSVSESAVRSPGTAARMASVSAVCRAKRACVRWAGGPSRITTVTADAAALRSSADAGPGCSRSRAARIRVFTSASLRRARAADTAASFPSSPKRYRASAVAARTSGSGSFSNSVSAGTTTFASAGVPNWNRPTTCRRVFTSAPLSSASTASRASGYCTALRREAAVSAADRVAGVDDFSPSSTAGSTAFTPSGPISPMT